MEQQDIFIAYHGTYADNGSLAKAKDLFYYLQSQGIKCYFFPNQNNDYFANTPIAAQKSNKFLFVCNDNVDVKEDGSIRNNGVYQEVTAFWNCIYEGNANAVMRRCMLLMDLHPKKQMNYIWHFRE